MSRWETYGALLAVVLASLSALKVGGHPRPVLAFAAIALLALVAYARLRRQLMGGRKKQRTFDAYERALQIQEQRDRKFRR
jgi:uncharacterized membrane protein YebE (DUF533 family)